MIQIDIEGQRFGRLLVLKREGTRNGNKLYLCQCDCGNLTHQRSDHIRAGRSKSCGCFRNEDAGRRARTHGKSGHSIYNRYHHMLKRCYEPSCPEYRWYGACGVTVCDRWNPAKGGCFENFYLDMGEPPTPKHELDKDLGGGKLYSPETCRWLTPRENKRVKRGLKLVTYNGKTQCVAAWAEDVGLSTNALSWRLRSGWAVERALSEPSRLAPK